MNTYCISDLHGHYENLERFINNLHEDDRVFVLGDVIDKGCKSIKCLRTIMSDKRFTMLLGNHEYMMHQFLSSKEGSRERLRAEDQWIGCNNGSNTLMQYNKLQPVSQGLVRSYIRNLLINIPNLEIGGRYFYLVHSNPLMDKQVKMSDLDYNEYKINDFVWTRRDPEDFLVFENKIVIAGHTPCQCFLGDHSEPKPYANSEKLENATYIDIDGGLATGLPKAKLIALCLDDLTYKLY